MGQVRCSARARRLQHSCCEAPLVCVDVTLVTLVTVTVLVQW